MSQFQLDCRGTPLPLAREPIIMGILNTTPDSFSDGGLYLDAKQAVKHALQMVADGAGIIDVGGESTRPGSQPIDAPEQIRRVVPVIESLRKHTDTPISIDTTDSTVAAAAIDAGAAIINDISALRHDQDMAPLAAQAQTPVILMHMQGTPTNMQADPKYANVVEQIRQFLAERIEFAVSIGIKRSQIVTDPGIGFGKTLEHNILLVKRLSEFTELDVPILIGPSRKSFIGKVLHLDSPTDRLSGTAACVAWSTIAGAHIIRVHDVKQMVQVVRMTTAILQPTAT